MNPELEMIGKPIVLNYLAGGMDGPTFHQRRKVTFNVYLEAGSIEACKQYPDAAERLGRTLGGMLNQYLQDHE